MVHSTSTTDTSHNHCSEEQRALSLLGTSPQLSASAYPSIVHDVFGAELNKAIGALRLAHYQSEVLEDLGTPPFTPALRSPCSRRELHLEMGTAGALRCRRAIIARRSHAPLKYIVEAVAEFLECGRMQH